MSFLSSRFGRKMSRRSTRKTRRSRNLGTRSRSAYPLRRLLLEPLECRHLLAAIVVNAADDIDDGVADAAHTSLREAINLANSTVGVEERIIFGIPGAGPHTIELASALPTVTDPVTIDGTTQPGYAGSPIIEVDSAVVADYVLTIATGDSTVQGLAVTNASVAAIQLSGGSGNLLSDLDLSWAGVDPTGTGVYLLNSSNNTIENVIATNRSIGIHLSGTSGDNLIQQNDLSGAGSYGIRTYYNTGQGNRYFNNNLSGAGAWSLEIHNDPEFEVFENDFSGSYGGLKLGNIDGVNISPAAGPGQAVIDVSTVTSTGLQLSYVTNSQVSGLDLSWSGAGESGRGINLNSSSGNTIENVIATNRDTGVHFSSSSGNTGQCTTILDNVTGVSVVGSSSGIVLNHNHIAGNSNYGVANGASALVNAENNYWGAPDGPGNLGGSGDWYSGNVDAEPFLAELPPCLVLNRASITGEVFVDVNQNGLYDANEPGIDGVIIELLDESGAAILDDLGNPITATTSNGGFYLFEDLDIGTYQLHEIQPSGVDDGPELLGSLGGVIPANDTMQLALERTDATDYVFAELGQQVTSGDTATIGFWHNKHGQALIAQGGTALAQWLTANFDNVFGDQFAGADGSDVARFFNDQLFKQKGKKSAGPAKVDAQFMAVALATYFTSNNLAGNVAAEYGFNVTDTGIGTRVVNVGSGGGAFNVADNTDLTIMQLLEATNELTDLPDGISGFAHIYDTNGDGQIDDSEAALRVMANDVYSMINEQGDI